MIFFQAKKLIKMDANYDSLCKNTSFLFQKFLLVFFCNKKISPAHSTKCSPSASKTFVKEDKVCEEQLPLSWFQYYNFSDSNEFCRLLVLRPYTLGLLLRSRYFLVLVDDVFIYYTTLVRRAVKISAKMLYLQ